jgi:hypothetical protein
MFGTEMELRNQSGGDHIVYFRKTIKVFLTPFTASLRDVF